jgi:hypothetical protein
MRLMPQRGIDISTSIIGFLWHGVSLLSIEDAIANSGAVRVHPAMKGRDVMLAYD